MSAHAGALWQPKQLSRHFWTLYASSCLIDFGFGLYFFLFSLFLVEHRFSEHAIGFITSAFTIGIIAGTGPVSFLARRLGLRTMLFLYVLATPFALALRVFFLPLPSQLALAFLSGTMMSIGSVCFSPALAKLTNDTNRAFGFSLFIATGIGSGAAAGLLGGYLPSRFAALQHAPAAIDGIRLVLLLACCIMTLAAFAIYRLRLDQVQIAPASRILSPFLLRFLLAIALWNFAIGFFTPFANVFLSRHLGLPLLRIGEIFTISQLIQVALVLLAPLLYRRFGLVFGIALTQIGAALFLCSLARASRPSSAICAYLLLTGLQWMSGPGIASLLMNRTPEQYRSHATAMQTILNLAAQAAAAALAGKMFERFGYSAPLVANAALAALAGALFYTLLAPPPSESAL